MIDQAISPAVQKATEKSLESDPVAKKIDEITKEIDEKQSDIIDLKAELSVVQGKRPEVTIKWRESIKWCLEIDADNPRYFLKSSAGVYKCIAFKHKVEITLDMKNKIATTLSLMFREKLIGRISHKGNHYYGLKDFFKTDLITLKDKHLTNVERLLS